MFEELPAASLDVAVSVSVGSVPLSPGVVMLAFSGPLTELDPSSASLGSADGPVRPPLSWLRLPDSQGRLLLLLAKAQPAVTPGAVLHVADERGLEDSVRIVGEAGLPALLGTTDPATLLAVLRFIAAKATGILRLSADGDLAQSCHYLAHSLRAPERTALPVALCGHDLMMWRLPDGVHAGAGAHYALGRRSLRRVAVDDGTLILPGRQFEGGYLLPAEGERPIHLAPAGGRLPTLNDLGRRKDPQSLALYRRGVAELARRATTGESAPRLLRDMQLLAPVEQSQHYAAPDRPFGAALEMALSDHAGGVFLRGWIRDPLHLIARLSLHCPYGERQLALEEMHRFPRPDLVKKYADAPHGGIGLRPGFALHLPDGAPLPVAQWRLRLGLTTGDTIDLTAPPGITHAQSARDAVLGAIAPAHVTPEIMARCIAPAVERLHRAVMQGRGTPEVVRIGREVPKPVASFIVPLYRNLRFLRHQLVAFARDPSLHAAELIYVLDSPEQREEIEHLLRGLHAIYRIPLTLVVHAGNYGYASACNAGAAEARAPVLLLLNSDVVPAGRNWLQHLLTPIGGGRRRTRLVAVGPKLLFEDGSLQHAGLFFELGPGGEWYNNHYYKGYPRHHPPAQEMRKVPGITGAAFCVRRDAFEAVGGFSTDYVIGDYEDSDLCLKLRAAGGEIAYVPQAELYHFERQSIRDHAGYARTLTSNYNRYIHHRRWAATIEQLMARTARRDLARIG
ncbi:MAG: glycosyltransferase family 2 protein [Acetobacteraceae bacterium]|nr:glycosyltransferase family 2 protein [Acetobacteraceae bacterium]